MCTTDVIACMCLCATCMQYPQRAEKGVGSLRTRVINCLCHYVHTDSKLCPLEEQLVLFTVEPSLHPSPFQYEKDIR